MVTAALSPPQAPVPRARLAFIDSLRFVAAGSVLLQHALERQGPLGESLVALVSPGVFGVALFFLVSGFVIPMSAAGSFRIATFATRRFWRIYPLVLFAFVLVAVAGWGLHLPRFEDARSASPFDWIANLLLVQDYVGATPLLSVTWTLSLEVAWYVLFAVGMVTMGRRFDDRLVIAAAFGMLLLAVISLLAGHRLPLGRLGMVYAALVGCRAWRYYSGELTSRRFMADVLTFMAVMATAMVVSFGYFSHPALSLYQAAIPWVLAPIVFFAVVALRPVRTSRLLNGPVFAYLGAISYSIYLLHPFALDLAGAYGPRAWFLPLGLVLTLALASVGYRWIEVPGQRLGRWLTRSRLAQ